MENNYNIILKCNFEETKNKSNIHLIFLETVLPGFMLFSLHSLDCAHPLVLTSPYLYNFPHPVYLYQMHRKNS